MLRGSTEKCNIIIINNSGPYCSHWSSIICLYYGHYDCETCINCILCGHKKVLKCCTFNTVKLLALFRRLTKKNNNPSQLIQEKNAFLGVDSRLIHGQF